MSSAHQSEKPPNVWELSAEPSLQITKQDQSATGGIQNFQFQDLSRTFADR